LECLEPGNLHLASGAPRGPEIEQDHFAAKIVELYGLARHVLQGEFRSRFSVLLRLQRNTESGLSVGNSSAYECQNQGRQLDSN
jgi:hypothetical protein